MNLDVHEAAAEAKCHPDTLRKMAKAGEAPGCKIGRKWVFPADLFNDWIKSKCLSTNAPGAPSGGSALAERLAARRAQRTAHKRKSSSKSSPSACGDGISSETVVPFPGKRRLSDG